MIIELWRTELIHEFQDLSHLEQLHIRRVVILDREDAVEFVVSEIEWHDLVKSADH